MADPIDVMGTLQGRLQVLGQALQTVVRDYAPNHLKGAIYVQVFIAPTRATLSLRVDGNQQPVQKYGTKDALAQEYGQGQQSVVGSSWSGRILPVNGTYLVFMGTHEYEGQLIFSRGVGLKTPHPGMAPFEHRGYVAPAIEEFKTTVLPSIDPDIRDVINITVRKSFPGARKT